MPTKSDQTFLSIIYLQVQTTKGFCMAHRFFGEKLPNLKGLITFLAP